eukprot:CAMPEP_0206442898 /NCGR_PEP_ID=MMETSP0324_2-20121206/14076_1 /ASSEMBLY_ACC=CAM_ASM_000836 /TAXON_ID=2866 /ORGANISM="Crypthecodinium cohnii, Strain Seligo" /LENGTH=120 /DNA_ID=CAMNT_0053910789 /DNA_START=345 /DNA_END=705 /DNA_ORIENTATION=+
MKVEKVFKVKNFLDFELALFSAIFLQLCFSWESLDGHANGEIRQNLLAAAVDSRDLVNAVEALHNSSHACASHTTTSENLHRIVGDQMADPGHGVLQECDPASQEWALGALLAHAVGDLV